MVVFKALGKYVPAVDADCGGPARKHIADNPRVCYSRVTGMTLSYHLRIWHILCTQLQFTHFVLSLPPRTLNHSSLSLSSMASLSARIFIRAINRELEIPTGLFINNEFVPSADSAQELIQ